MNKTQKEVQWIQNPLINMFRIKTMLIKKVHEKNEFYKGANFYNKLDANEKTIFTDYELGLLEDIKKTVQESVSSGSHKYIYHSQYVKKYLIPILKKVLEFGDHKAESLKYDTVSAKSKNKRPSKAMQKAIAIAKEEIKNVKL